MALSGDLVPFLIGQGQGLQLARAGGERVLQFVRLKAFDPRGRFLPSRWRSFVRANRMPEGFFGSERGSSHFSLSVRLTEQGVSSGKSRKGANMATVSMETAERMRGMTVWASRIWLPPAPSVRMFARFLLLSLALALSALPLHAVSPMPPYTSYPCQTPSNPPENCQTQAGPPTQHAQSRISFRSANSVCTPVGGQFGGFCDGGSCTSTAGYCRQPSILGLSTGQVFVTPSGPAVQFNVEYDFPNAYCQLDLQCDFTCAWWPLIFNNIHRTRLQILNAAGTQVLMESMAVFEHGVWNPILPIACLSPQTFKVRVITLCSPTLSQTQDVTVTFDTKICPPDKDKCQAPGKPLNIGSGDVSYAEPLFTISQSPTPLQFTLAFHSQQYANAALVSSPIGNGWTHTFNQSMRAIDVGGVYLYHVAPDGREFFYTRQSPGVWNASRPAELRGQVTAVGSEYRLTDLDGTVRAFDIATGHWVSTTDRWGNSMTATYSGSDLTAVTDSVGRQVTLGYTTGKLTNITADGKVWRLGYTVDRLTSLFDPLHAGATAWKTFQYATDSNGIQRLMSEVRDDAGKLLEGHSYDAQDRGTTSVSEGGRESVTIQYDVPSVGQRRVTHQIDGTTNQVSDFTLVYQAGRWLPTLTDGVCATCGGGGGDRETFLYDTSNHVTQKVVGKDLTGTGGTDERVHTNVTYDSNGMILTRTEAFNKPETRTTTYVYGYVSPAGKAWPAFVTSVTEASAARAGQNKVTTYSWNTSGTPETTLTTQVSGYLDSAAAATITTTTLFDAQHRQTEVDGPAVNQKTTFAYYPDNDATLNRPGRLHQTSVYTSAAEHLDTQFDDYDIFGIAGTVIDPNGLDSNGNPIPNGARTVKTTDAKGRVRTVVSKQPVGDPNEPTDYTTSYTYDSRDRLTTVTLPLLNKLQSEYEDGSNRLLNTVRIDSSGNQQERMHLTLNVIGGKMQEEAQVCASPAPACANWSTKRSDSFSYDVQNRLSSIVHPDATHIDYTYDSRGNLKTVKDENHSSANTSYGYDRLNRLTSVAQTLPGAPGRGAPCVSPAGQITTCYTYDVQDDLISATDPNGNTTSYAYDDFRRLQTQTSPVSGVTRYSYDSAGNLTSSTDGSGVPTTRAYDAANRVLSSVSGTGGGQENVTWTYDGVTAGAYGKGRLATMTDPSGSTAYAYERRGLLRSESRTVQTDPYSLGYGYDANGNRGTINYPSGRVVKYTFDFADRALTACSGGTGPTCTGGTSYVSAASYQPFGPESSLSFGNGTTKTMSYDNRYRPNENKLVKNSPLTTLADYVYAKDFLGNITGIADATDGGYSRTFGYDELNRLTTANSGASLWGAGTYAYDAMGNMISKSLGSSTAGFSYVGTTPKLSSVTENGAQRFVFYDAAGNESSVGGAPYVYSPRNYLSTADALAYTYDGRGLRAIVDTSVGAPAPTVSSINPTSGTTAGGTPVTITGTNFPAGATVSLGGVAATGVTVTPPNSITATTGAHAAGAVNVVVTNPDTQSGTLTNGFTYVTPAPAPTVSSINPTAGTTAGGTPVTITGTNFQAGATVSLGGVAATGVTVTPPNTITATTGAHAAGPVNVVVTNPDSQSGTLANGFTYVAPAPTVSSINPTSGTTAGGTPVTITGSNFQSGATVSLGGVAATGVTVTPPSTINATTGAHAAGVANVVVTNPDTQSGTLTNGFTYVAPAPAPTVSSINPTSGTTAGGTPVTITGTNFQAGATVNLGGVATTGVTVTPPNTITATTGAHAAGLVNVVVTNPDSQNGTLTNGFTYVAPPSAPTIGSFSPASGAVGASVTINGTNFTGATTVTFNGTSASFTVNTSIKITATVPANATTGVISVTTPGGTATSASNFTVAPRITSFTPTSGAIGVSVVITGANFTAATSVKFNGTSATFAVNSSTQVTTTVPANATTGPITVTTSAGTATSSINFTVAPRITSFTPANGPIGSSVTINGANFMGATAVKFNGTSASFTVNTAIKITATVPSGATTGLISVTTLAGTATSATSFTVTFVPTITSFAPTGGAVGVGVTITGMNFAAITAVKFNGISATFTVNSLTQITTTVPANATTGPITVTNSAGTGTSSTSFIVAPRITGFTPTTGPVNTSVTINGANFTAATSVKFNGTAATFTVNTSIKITAAVPAGATTGKITVTTSAGTATSTSNFTVKPNITSFTPTSGAVGASVTITGTTFTGATSVKFNGTSATFHVDLSTQITTTVPANATTGPISVTTAGGTATSSTSFTVAPRLTSFTPSSGAVGTSVAISGANFTGTTSVNFNGTPTTFAVNSSVKVTAPVPAGAGTGKISVTTPAGTGISATDFTVTVAALGGAPLEIADAGLDASEGAGVEARGRAYLAEGPPASMGMEVDSERVEVSRGVTELTQAAADQKRLPVERVASLAFPFTTGRDSAVDLSLRNVRLLGGDWPMSGDSGSPTRLMESPDTRPEEAFGDGAATASVGIRPQAVTAVGRRYSFYSPEMSLLAETEIKTSAGAPAIQYEYIWFNGHPVAQVDPGPTTHWTFTDHLGTPLIQTDASGTPYWRAEHEPYGRVFSLRTADQHQPLRLPGQEAEELNTSTDGNGATERSYNIFRWYRSAWGRYTQPDPLGRLGRLSSADAAPSAGLARGDTGPIVSLPFRLPDYQYGHNSPVQFKDPLGLDAGGMGQGPILCVQNCAEGLNRAKFVCSILATAGFLACTTHFTTCFYATGGVGSLPCAYSLAKCIGAVIAFHALCDSAADGAYSVCLQQCRCARN
jgi:RHS repeat-associated protein